MILSAAMIAAASMHSLGAPPTKTKEEEEAETAQAKSIMKGLESPGGDEKQVKEDFFLPDKTFLYEPLPADKRRNEARAALEEKQREPAAVWPETPPADRASKRRAQREYDKQMKQTNKKRRHR